MQIEEQIKMEAERLYPDPEPLESDGFNNPYVAAILRGSFLSGANFVLELMGYKELHSFVREIATMWDCDSDSHKYDLPCRACMAQALLNKLPPPPKD